MPENPFRIEEKTNNWRAVKMNKKTKKIMRKIFISTVTLAMALMLVSGCSRQEDSTGSEQRFITIKGSDTMVHLASSWAETFMKQNPDMEVSVTGGGSGTGIAALLNGTTDICAASRKIKNKELKLALQKNIHPHEIAVAKDGIAVVVHPDNPVKELTLQQLSKIFTEKSFRWSDVGGHDEEILVLSRESSSGTYVFFQEMVLKKQDYMQDAKLMPATSAIIQSVSTDKLAIGYVGLGYALAAKDKVKIVAVKADDNSPAVMPSDQTVKTGQYPIARPLFLYLNGEPKGTVKKFMDFCLSVKGQAVVTDTGYVSVR
jgi:phosphate transport system substrate-binding protein